jgi:hypothetical protein
MDVPPALRALVSAGCKVAQNTLGAGGAWCVGHDVVARFVLLFFVFMRSRGHEMSPRVARFNR